MAAPLKNEFNQVFVSAVGQALAEEDSTFDFKGFQYKVVDEHWEERELKNRMRHISMCIRQASNLSYSDQLNSMIAIASRFKGLQAMTFPDYVEVHGLDELEKSVDALEYMTRFSSSEFAIRPYIVQDEAYVMNRMLDWSKDENEHVRRLASEGCRPRLPWAMALTKFKKDASIILPILENLKEDDSLYVRKSVANNINDITKDNPEVAARLCQSWYGNDDKTDWIVKHGLRSLLKKGDEDALTIIGFNKDAKIKCDKLNISKTTVKRGSEFEVSFEITNEELTKSFAKIGYEVGYMKSNGKLSFKIFHVTEQEFKAGSSMNYAKKISFKDLSTRKHYTGKHQINILANGVVLNSMDFILID